MELSDNAKQARNEYQNKYKRQMSDAARDKAAEYQRQWRKKNRDKLRQYNINYWERKAQESSPAYQAKRLKKQGLTQRQIAEKMEISLGMVNKLLNS